MNTKSSILKKVLYVIILLAIIAVMVVKLKTNKEITQNKIYKYDKEQAIHVQADTLYVENINAKFLYSGTFEPYKETKISAELQGKINTLLVDVGSVVIKGQTLVQLDHSLLKLQVQTIDLQVEGLEADVDSVVIGFISKLSMELLVKREGYLEALEKNLPRCEAEEEYELCAKVKIWIDKLKQN